MGADGHIALYDWSKTVRQFPELEVNKDLRCLVVGNAYIYSNPFGDGKLLVSYWGDNLCKPTFPGYENWFWNDKIKDKNLHKKAKDIVQWMQDNAVIVGDWEVWT